MDVDKISIIILAVSLLAMTAMANYLITRLSAFTIWQKELLTSLAELSRDALDLADKED